MYAFQKTVINVFGMKQNGVVANGHVRTLSNLVDITIIVKIGQRTSDVAVQRHVKMKYPLPRLSVRLPKERDNALIQTKLNAVRSNGSFYT